MAISTWVLVAGICCNNDGNFKILKADPTLGRMPPMSEEACNETALDLKQLFMSLDQKLFVHCEPKNDGED